MMQLTCSLPFSEVSLSASVPDLVRIEGSGRIYGLAAGEVEIIALKDKERASVKLTVEDGGSYDVVIDAEHPINGGDFQGFNGDQFHFNEDGVLENYEGRVLTIGPTGSISLSTAIRGITEFKLVCEEESYYYRTGYHPGQYDNFEKANSGEVIDSFGACGGLRIVNNSATDLHITSISFRYTRTTEVDTIVNETKAHVCTQI